MTKKKAAKPKPRSTFECSLDVATRRLEKALAEQQNYSARLQALEREIPHLQAVIRVLAPMVGSPSGVSMAAPVTAAATTVTLPPLRSPLQAPGVPAHLEKFLRHIPQVPPLAATPPNGEVDPAPEDQDTFLNDGLGKELLP
jgi:hypothetical protein